VLTKIIVNNHVINNFDKRDNKHNNNCHTAEIIRNQYSHNILYVKGIGGKLKSDAKFFLSGVKKTRYSIFVVND